MEDKAYDKLLNIKTLGLRDWSDSDTLYNRYEGTPYKALDCLFEEYPISENDKIVDFGSGKGRVAFYIHHRFKSKLVGIEAHDLTFQEALENKERYIKKLGQAHIDLDFKHVFAEDYKIEEDFNIFYFFNPFSIKIFRLVVENILKSFKEKNRTLDLILYYPFPDYRHFIETKTPFKVLKTIRVDGEWGKLDEFIVYRLEGTR